MRIRKTLTIMLAALTMVACNKYDDSELREQVNKNTEALQNLQTLMNTNDYITGVTPVMEGGVEIGYTITFLKSQPITIYNGQKGQDGDSFFSSVDTSNPEYVVFTLTDGTQFTVPRYMGIKLEFDITDIKLGRDNNIDINITAEGSTDFTQDNFFVVTPDGWKNTITKTADPGKEFTLNLTSPADKDSEGEVLVMLDNKQGNTTIGRIKVDSKSTYLVIKDATAGKIAEAIREHDMEYIVASGSFNKTDWNAIAANRNTLLHLDLENCIYEGGNGEDLIYWNKLSPDDNILLETLRLPQNITKIGDEAFALCVGLTDVKLPDKMESIGKFAFSQCSHLTEIKLPDGLKEIKEGLFYKCTNLTNITLPDGLKSIGNKAFLSCSALTEIKLPDGLESIGTLAFYECTSLTNITIHDGLKSISNQAFWKCSALTEIKLPEGLTNIEEEAFYNCSALTSIKLPEGLKEIKRNTFYGCSSLTDITFPDGLEIIELGAFWECTLLTTITLPKSIKTIYDAFYNGCTSLTTVTCLAETPPALDLNAFPHLKLKAIYVPAGLVETYKTISTSWSLYADIITAIP